MKISKWLILVGAVLLITLLILLFFVQESHCQEMTSQEKILTEISIDVKYIKANINELKTDFKSIQADLKALDDKVQSQLLVIDKRMTTVEGRTDNLERVICNIEKINTYFLGILAAIIGGLVLYQYKRASNFRKDDRA